MIVKSEACYVSCSCSSVLENQLEVLNSQVGRCSDPRAYSHFDALRMCRSASSVKRAAAAGRCSCCKQHLARTVSQA